MIRTEFEVCKALKAWMENFGIKCWLNEGNDKFTTKLSQKKVDMIIYSKILNQYIAIEVKVGDNEYDISNSVKIIDYLDNYIKGNIIYLIENKQINISSFCVATIGAMNGKVFLNDLNPKDSFKSEKGSWGKTQIKCKLEPRWEYPFTKKFLRQSLWNHWRRIRGKNQPGVGVILADILNENDIEEGRVTHPLLFDMQWRMSFRNKLQWKARQKLL